MDFKFFFAGLMFLFIAYFMYHFLLKNEKPSSKKTNWEGMTGVNYVRLWGSVIIFCIIGIGFMLKSLP